MSSTRRNFFQNAAAFSAALFGLSDQLKAQAPPPLKRTACASCARRRHFSRPARHHARRARSPVRTRRQRQSLPSHERSRETQNRAIQNHRRLGLQRQLPRPDDPDQSRRSRPRHLRKSPARIHDRPLARTRNSDRTRRRPVDQPKTDSARRKIHLRIHGPSGRNIFLSRAQRDAGNARPDRSLHRASRKTLQTARRSRLRHRSARVGGASEQLRSEQRRHGIQLAHLQRRFRSRDHADDRAPRQPRPSAHRESRHGSPSDPSARQSIRADRHRRRPRAGIKLVSDEHRSRRRRASARRRVRREVSRLVDGSLPSSPSHDEQHDGSASRSSDHHRRADRSASAQPNDDARKNRRLRTRPPLADRRRRRKRKRLPAGRLHGNGNGFRRRETRNARPPR